MLQQVCPAKVRGRLCNYVGIGRQELVEHLSLFKPQVGVGVFHKRPQYFLFFFGQWAPLRFILLQLSD
jgi:hypothetical protein